MHVRCSCGKTLKVADNLAGKKIRCPACKAVVQLPAEAEGEGLIETVQEEAMQVRNQNRPRRHEQDEAPRARLAADDEYEAEPRSRRRHARHEDEDDRPRRRNKGQPAVSFLRGYGLYLGIGGGVAVAAAVAVVILLLSGGAGAGRKDGVGAAPPLADFGSPPTEEECRAFAGQLQVAVAAGNTAEVNRLYRLDHLAQRCLSDLDIKPATRQRILVSGSKQLRENWLADDLIKSVRKEGKFTFRGIRKMDGRPCLLMRLITPHEDGGSSFEYQHILLARYADGQIAAEDVHYLSEGERISQTIRRHWIAAAARIDQGLLTKLSANERLYSKHLMKIDKLIQALDKERGKEALRIYDSLPAELQQEKALLIWVLRATTNNEDYLRLLDTFRKHHGNDPAVAFWSMSYHFDKKEFDQDLLCVDRIDQAVGGDPYLHVQRGAITMAAERLADSKVHFEKAIREEPKLEEAYWSRINVALTEKNYGETLTWLKKVVEQCGVTVDEEAIKNDQDYAAFVQSPQFREFQEWYKSRQR